MHVGMTHTGPIPELDAQFEGGFGLADEVVLVDPQSAYEFHDRGDRGLAHADGADLLGLDQSYAHFERLQEFGEARSRHPAGRAAAHDGDAPDGGGIHDRNYATGNEFE